MKAEFPRLLSTISPWIRSSAPEAARRPDTIKDEEEPAAPSQRPDSCFMEGDRRVAPSSKHASAWAETRGGRVEAHGTKNIFCPGVAMADNNTRISKAKKTSISIGDLVQHHAPTPWANPAWGAHRVLKDPKRAGARRMLRASKVAKAPADNTSAPARETQPHGPKTTWKADNSGSGAGSLAARIADWKAHAPNKTRPKRRAAQVAQALIRAEFRPDGTEVNNTAVRTEAASAGDTLVAVARGVVQATNNNNNAPRAPAQQDSNAATDMTQRLAALRANIATTQAEWLDRPKPGPAAPAASAPLPALRPPLIFHDPVASQPGRSASARDIAEEEELVHGLRLQVRGLRRQVLALHAQLLAARQLEAELIVDRKDACDEFRRVVDELRQELLGTQDWMGRLADDVRHRG